MLEVLERATGLFTGASLEAAMESHRETLSRVHERATHELLERVMAFRERPVLIPGLAPPREALAAHWRQMLEERPAAEPPGPGMAGFAEDFVVRKQMFLAYLMSYLSPPYMFGTPFTPQVMPTTNWYPVSVACASPGDGRMDVGAFSDHGVGQEFFGCNISESTASLSAISPVLVQKPSTLTVYALAKVDAVCQGWAVAQGELAMAALQLFLTVTTGTAKETCGQDVDVTMVKQSDPMPLFNHVIAGKSFELHQEIDLPASSLVMMSLSAKATTAATKSGAQGWNCYGIVDAEGLARPEGMCQPKGEYYPVAGGISVPWFAYKVVPK